MPAIPASRVDVLISGGGLVGCALACALEGSGLSVLLVESTPLRGPAPPSFDERKLALAEGSLNALTALGVLPLLQTLPEPIRGIHVSSRGDFGSVRLNAGDFGLDRFGAVVIARELGQALETRVAGLQGTQRLRPATLSAAEPAGDALRVSVAGDAGALRVEARLLVVAEGSDSALRGALGFAVEAEDYDQVLFLATVEAERANPGQAFERFTDSGPVALLPLPGGCLGAVLCVRRHQAEAVAALDEAGYRDLLQERFGWRVGRFTRIGTRSHYPMRRIVAQETVQGRAVLVGNAAQTLHPIGAQGFNLGLRDALVLAEQLGDSSFGNDPGDAARLAAWQQARAPDRDRTLAASDGLVRLFANPFPPLRLLRSLGLAAMGQFPGLAGGLVAEAMGYGATAPRLNRERVA
jgi:2-octaprenyl-6-methoxyphenol hydroxylase